MLQHLANAKQKIKIVDSHPPNIIFMQTYVVVTVRTTLNKASMVHMWSAVECQWTAYKRIGKQVLCLRVSESPGVSRE